MEHDRPGSPSLDADQTRIGGLSDKEPNESTTSETQQTLGIPTQFERSWQGFLTWFQRLELSENATLLAFAVAIGVLSAAGVILFYQSIDVAYTVFYRWPATFLPRVSFAAYRPLITAAGLVLAWWVMHRLGRAHDGMNVPDVQLAVVRRGAEIPGRPAIARTLASAITIGGGGSAGSEGPVVVLGAAIGSWLGRAFRFAPSRTIVLVGAASGAGISAAFNAPLAGAFFALEEIIGTFAGASFAPVVVASVVAAVISRSVFGNHPAFPIPAEYGYGGLTEVVIFFPLLGVVVGIAAAFFVRLYFRIADLAKHIPVRGLPLAALGGTIVGLMVFFSGGLLVGYGHLAVHLDVFGRMPWYALLALAVSSMIATAVTLNFGGSGGVFTPSLYAGAASGGAFGVALASLFPSLGLHPEAYAIVGMGAMVASATDAPITGMLLVFEMTNDYAIVLPLMLSVVVAHTVARRIERDSLYSGWLRRRGESIEHGEDRAALVALRVEHAYDRDAVVFNESDSADAMLSHLGRADQTTFPVTDSDGHLVGVITTMELGRIAREDRSIDTLLLAMDLARPTETVTANDSLLTATKKMGVRGASALPVVEPTTGRLVGMVTRAHILALYERTIAGESGP